MSDARRKRKRATLRDVADLTGLSESAVKTQLHRARKMLADEIRTKGALANVLPSIT